MGESRIGQSLSFILVRLFSLSPYTHLTPNPTEQYSHEEKFSFINCLDPGSLAVKIANLKTLEF
jgi:hypothetical protein